MISSAKQQFKSIQDIFTTVLQYGTHSGLSRSLIQDMRFCKDEKEREWERERLWPYKNNNGWQALSSHDRESLIALHSS